MDGKTDIEKFELKDSKTDSAWSKDREKNVPRLKQILKPMLYGLAIAGNYSFSDINSIGANSGNTKSTLSKIYRAVIIVLLLTFITKYMVCYFYLPNDYLLFNSLCTIWAVYVLCFKLYNLKATSSKFGHYEKVFKFWDQKIVPEFEELGIEYPASKLRKGVIKYIILAVIIVVFNVAGMGVQIYVSGGYFYTAPFESNPYTLTLFLILITVATLVWVSSLAFIICCTKLIEEAFNSLNDYKSNLCNQNGCKMAENFQKVRLLHLNLCKLVSELDEDFGWFHAINFTFSTGISVFTLYQIIKKPLTVFELVMFVCWLLFGLASIGLPTIRAALVNDARTAMN